MFGTYTVLNGSYANGKVPLKLYNNYVRWVSVYVEYLKADGTNLSLSDAPTWPDTKHAKSLGLLPQVFTLLGVPIWDTNTIEVTLDFPAEATTARLLFCGLGSDLVGGGWRQYFPASVYPDHIAPQDEVMTAALMTGILSIGISAFALATDANVATFWGSVKSYVKNEAIREALLAMSNAVTVLTAAEVFATSVAVGGAAYADVAANRGDLSNLWSILVNLGSVIPKVIFNPKVGGSLFAAIARAIGTAESAAAIEKALPIIGEVLAVITAVGDAITLAESIGETIASPWVIEN